MRRAEEKTRRDGHSRFYPGIGRDSSLSGQDGQAAKKRKPPGPREWPKRLPKKAVVACWGRRLGGGRHGQVIYAVWFRLSPTALVILKSKLRAKTLAANNLFYFNNTSMLQEHPRPNR